MFAQVDLPIGEPVLVGLPRYFHSDGKKHDVVLRLNKSLYGEAKSARLWYEILLNSLLDFGFAVIKVDPCLFMSNNWICVIYMEYLFIVP